MPPKKPNGFMIFTIEWKAKHGNHLSLPEATTQAGLLWEKMTEQQRAVYKERAKGQVIQGKPVEKLTTAGISISAVEKQKQEIADKDRQMKLHIESIVAESVKNDKFKTQRYYFIKINYFTKIGTTCAPAEISIAEYSLEGGINRMFHVFVNPVTCTYGSLYEMQLLSQSTHKLPLPPDAMGETNLGNIYKKILDFIREGDGDKYPPIYTMSDDVPIVKAALNYLSAELMIESAISIYSLQHLFFVIKETTAIIGETDRPNHFVTDAFLERDFYEYQGDIGCEFHNQCDRTHFCTQSYVTRWAFMFSDYVGGDIALKMIPGRHVPITTNIEAVETRDCSFIQPWDDGAASSKSFNAQCLQQAQGVSNESKFSLDASGLSVANAPWIMNMPVGRGRGRTGFNNNNNNLSLGRNE